MAAPISPRDLIITLPNKHLRERSQKVGYITDAVREIVSTMEKAVIDWEETRAHELGVALAAVQIDKLYRIVVVRQDFDDRQNHHFDILINPEIVKLEGEIVEDFEGCLSIKDVYGKVPRHSKVKVKATGLDGKQVRLTAEGFLARILQHEIDHTKGVLFIDHIKDKPEAFFRLQDNGELEALDYDKEIRNSSILW
jgi:peptide deformylase